MSKMYIAAAALLAAGALTSHAQASDLVTNGGFETGDFTGWTVTNQAGSAGNWYVTGNGANSPVNGFTTLTLAGGGGFVAQTDQSGAGSHTLSQTFTGVAGQGYILSFDASASNSSHTGPVGTGIDFHTDPNQHVQVTISSGAESLIYYGIMTKTWGHYSFDVSSAISANGLYTLAFSEVDNKDFLNETLDNVSLVTQDVRGAVPEPATWALMVAGFIGAGLALRRRPLAA